MNARIEEIKRKIIPLLEPYGVTRAGLFGSVVHGIDGQNSDIDLLVKIEKDISLLEFIGLKQNLEECLGRKVDLVEYETLKPVIKDRILREEVRIV